MYLSNLKVNHLDNPVGYTMGDPVFSWTVEPGDGLGESRKQEAARILIWRFDGDEKVIICDTGWAKDLDSRGGCPLGLEGLKPRTRYYWSVSVRTDAGVELTSEDDGEEHYFETGKMDEPWQAKWIGCDDSEVRHPVFVKKVDLTETAAHGGIACARLYITGLGLYEAFWNGNRIGNEHLTPYSNNYNAWVQYQTYDVTDLLQAEGMGDGLKNVGFDAPEGLAVMLGNGWYKGRFGFNARSGAGYYGAEWKMIAELRVRCADGTEMVVGTDDSWAVLRSKITFSNAYDGEVIDLTLPALPAVPARLADAPSGVLMARLSTPVTVHEKFAAPEILTTPAGETVLDIGQNMAGKFSLKVREPAGTKIFLQVGEVLQGGNFYNENLRSAKAEYTFITDGGEYEIIPHFTWFGYRYVKLTGLSHFEKEDFTALVLYSELPQTGTLVTGDAKINQLIHNAEWGQRGNFIDVPTDCPQRDERMGWTGDAQVFCGTATLQRDSYAFFEKYLYDMKTEQDARDGEVPCVVPAFDVPISSSAWGDATCIIPWDVYKYTGDPKILAEHLNAMCAWVEFLNRTEGDNHGWRKHFHFGDWLALDGPDGIDGTKGGTDEAYIAASYHRRSTLCVVNAAKVLAESAYAGGHYEKEIDPAYGSSYAAVAEKYQKLADDLLADIRNEYFTATGKCAIGTQTGLLLALSEGLTPNPEKSKEELLERINYHHGNLATGFVGTPLLAPTLTAIGRPDLAFNLLLNENYPGWLYEVNLGATTVWERWNSVLADGSISSTGMNSLNHYAYGSIVEWIYRDVAGLTPAEPGFRKARIVPHMHAALGSCAATYASTSGTWKAAWEILPNDSLRFTCTVPFGCEAHVELPYGGGTYELTAGDFQMNWIPDAPVRKIFTVDNQVTEVFADPRAKKALFEAVPGIGQIPNSMMGMTFRQIAELQNLGEMLTMIQAVLEKIR